MVPPLPMARFAMPLGVLKRINAFNAAHPWSHNDFYHRWLLRQLPDRPSRTIDVGCGTGSLVRALAQRSDVAMGIDVDPVVIDLASRHPARGANESFAVVDLRDASAAVPYDAVTAVAAVHHLPLLAALSHMRSLLAPGGTLVVIGCYREVTWLDHLAGLVAIPANMVLGLLKSPGAAEATVAMSAPTVRPQTTIAEVRDVAARLLPGARIRRRFFWRYSLVWRAPAR